MEILNCKIVKIFDKKTFDSGFQIVEFVVETNDQYPQLIKLQCNKEKADNLIKFNKVGDVVDCSINLQGRAWTNKEGVEMYFNTIECWKCFKSGAGDAAGKDTTAPKAAKKAAPVEEDGEDSLPF